MRKSSVHREKGQTDRNTNRHWIDKETDRQTKVEGKSWVKREREKRLI